jgi:hypothetical protein
MGHPTAGAIATTVVQNLADRREVGVSSDRSARMGEQSLAPEPADAGQFTLQI